MSLSPRRTKWERQRNANGAGPRSTGSSLQGFVTDDLKGHLLDWRHKTLGVVSQEPQRTLVPFHFTCEDNEVQRRNGMTWRGGG